MHRRDAAQGGEAQIRLRRQRRSADEGFGRVVHIRDEAEPLALVEGAGLHRDIGGGVAQAEKGGQTGPQRLGHDLAARVGQELVDHHPVKTRHGPDLMGRELQEAFKRRGPLQLADHALDQHHGIGRQGVGALAGDDFHDGVRGRHVNREVVALGSLVDQDIEQTLHPGRHHGRLKHVAQVMHGLPRHDEVERLVDEVLARPPEEAARIGRNSADHPARKRTQDQAAVRLDGARHVDPLTLARRQVGHGGQGRSDGPFDEIHDVHST